MVFKLTLEDFFVYRLNFLLWRLRSFLFFLTLVFFWQAIYQEKDLLFNYSQEKMLSYVVGIAFLRGIVFGSRSLDEVPGLIKGGGLVSWLIRPVSLFPLFFSRDLAVKFLDLIFIVVEVSLVVKLLDLNFYLPQHLSSLFLFAIALFLSVFLYFSIGVVISAFSFWLENIWAVRWLLGIIFLEFLSGVYFPLDILPDFLQKIINLTPFPYLLYFPLKIWTEQVDFVSALRIVLILISWLIIFIFLGEKIWRKGLKDYSAYGG